MRVKKFEAKSMKDALQMVKKELGPDAVILSARDNRGSFGLGGQASVEITAAVSETTLQKKRFVESRLTATDRARFDNSDARTQRKIIDKMVDRRNEEAEEAPPKRRSITRTSYIDIQDDESENNSHRASAFKQAAGRNVAELLEDFDQGFEQNERARIAAAQARRSSGTRGYSAPVQSAPQQPINPPAAASAADVQSSEKALSRIRSAAREAWKAGLFTSDEATQSAKSKAEAMAASGAMEMIRESAPTAAPQTAEIASLKSEIDRLHKVLETFQKVPQTFTNMHPGADYGIPYDLSAMYQKLIDAGVTVDHAVEMLQVAAKEIDPVQMKKRPMVDAWVARFLLNNIQTVQNPWAGRVHLFVGGAGSGKTSHLVKLASQLVVKERKKVAILTTDAIKVGAVDQLKIYCQILNVPFAVIRNRKDWEWVLSQLNHLDHILVDFPGFQLRDLDEIHLLKSLLPPSEVGAISHLCVSATTKDGDAYEIARRYKVTDYSDLVFTNLDQSVQHGIIYNLHKKTGKPLHSFGIGNRIPEDFEAASKERVLDLIFKLTKLRRETK